MNREPKKVQTKARTQVRTQAKTSSKATVNAKTKSKSNVKAPALSAELLFAIMALVTVGITLWVTAFRHADYLIETSDLNPFFTTSDFWSACLGRAGGGVVYLGALLATLFHVPWLGATVLALVLVALAYSLRFAFHVPAGTAALCYVPVLMLLLNFTQLGYMIYVLKAPALAFAAPLGMLAAAWLAWLFGKLKKPLFRTLCILLVVVVGYPLLGFYALLALVLMAFEGLHRMQWSQFKPATCLNVLVGLAAALLVPYLCYVFFYSGMRGADIYTAPLPDYQFTASEWQLWLPLFIAFFFIVCLPFWARLNPRLAFIRVVSLVVFLLAGVGAVRCTYDDENFTAILRMEHAVDEGDWQQVLSIARDTKSVPTRLQVLFKNLALFELGTAPDAMFSFSDGDTPYNAPRQHQYLRLIGARSLYYYYGKVNYSYRWCMEDFVEYGHRPAYLRYMAKCALVNGEKALASKYLEALSHVPFNGAFAKKYQAYVDQPALQRHDKEMSAIAGLMHYNNLLDGDGGFIEVYLLNSFALTEGGPRQMVDLSLQCNLILKDIPRFWPRFIRLLPTWKGHIPVHYQEAALLFANLEEKYDISRLPIDPAVRRRFDALVQASAQNGSRGNDYNRVALQPSFGDTYWYYYFFVTGLKTN
jgi:hypothetical protein